MIRSSFKADSVTAPDLLIPVPLLRPLRHTECARGCTLPLVHTDLCSVRPILNAVMPPQCGGPSGWSRGGGRRPCRGGMVVHCGSTGMRCQTGMQLHRQTDGGDRAPEYAAPAIRAFIQVIMLASCQVEVSPGQYHSTVLATKMDSTIVRSDYKAGYYWIHHLCSLNVQAGYAP